MDYTSKINNLGNSIYLGVLTGGQQIVYIGGKVTQSDCQWAIDRLDELIAETNEAIVFDYSTVENVPHSLFSNHVQFQQHDSVGNSKIIVRDSRDCALTPQLAEQCAAPGDYVQNSSVQNSTWLFIRNWLSGFRSRVQTQ